MMDRDIKVKAMGIDKAHALIKTFGLALAYECANECSKVTLPNSIHKDVNYDYIELGTEFWHHVLNTIEKIIQDQ